MAVAIAVVRAKPFKDKSTQVRASTTSLLCVGLAVIWLFLWHVIPRPAEPRPEPPTKEEIADAVLKKLDLRAAMPQPPTSLTVTSVKPKSAGSSSSANQIADAIVAKLPKTPELSNDLLIAAAQTVSNQLRNWIGEWRAADTELGNKKYEAYENLRNRGASPKELQENDEKWAKEINSSREALQKKLEAIMANADSLRRMMLQKIPQSNWTAEDREMDKNFKSLPEATVANYLEHLTKKI
jgi:hypothetical protein